MIECQKLGLTKSIGVSNFNRRQLQMLIDGSSVIPANLQVCLSDTCCYITCIHFRPYVIACIHLCNTRSGINLRVYSYVADSWTRQVFCCIGPIYWSPWRSPQMDLCCHGSENLGFYIEQWNYRTVYCKRIGQTLCSTKSWCIKAGQSLCCTSGL